MFSAEITGLSENASPFYPCLILLVNSAEATYSYTVATGWSSNGKLRFAFLVAIGVPKSKVSAPDHLFSTAGICSISQRFAPIHFRHRTGCFPQEPSRPCVLAWQSVW